MGSRRTKDGVERVYEAAEAWVDRALRTDDSLFTPGKAIWSSRWLGELPERFLDQPDESKESLLVKLEHQLQGSIASSHPETETTRLRGAPGAYKCLRPHTASSALSGAQPSASGSIRWLDSPRSGNVVSS